MKNEIIKSEDQFNKLNKKQINKFIADLSKMIISVAEEAKG